MIDNIFVISLARCSDRREHMARMMTSIGLDYTLVEAADGNDVEEMSAYSADPMAFFQIHNSRRRPTPGEFGCYVSHLMAMEKVLSSGRDWGCIMEDDLKITRPAEEIDRITRRQLTDVPDFDIFYPGKPVMRGTEALLKNPRGSSECIELAVPPVGTQCYFVSARFASHIVDNFPTFYREIDQLYRSIPSNGDTRWLFYAAKPEDYWVEQDFKFKSQVRK